MPQVQRACPVCQHQHVDVTFDNAMLAVGDFDMSYTIGCCKHCGFHFAYLLADDATFQSYYGAVSKYDVAAHVSSLDQLRIDAAVSICKGYILKSDMVVDLGCGFGALLSCLKTAGWSNLHGIDPAPRSAQRARELFGLDNIHRATMAQAHNVLPLDTADLVCIMAVLEHLPNLRDDMTALLSKLRPGCKILVEVPAVEYFSCTHSEPFGEFSLEHIQFFTATSLRNLFENIGASTIAMKMQALPLIRSGSVFGLFERSDHLGPTGSLEFDNGTAFVQYVEGSSKALKNALQHIPHKPLIIYGAGSHSARIIPQLEIMPGIQIAAVVDGNPNLLGKSIGQWTVQSPSIIDSMPDLHIFVSSFRSQNEIATNLKKLYPNPLVLMYT